MEPLPRRLRRYLRRHLPPYCCWTAFALSCWLDTLTRCQIPWLCNRHDRLITRD